MIGHARADGRVCRNGVGRGSVGIDTEVDVAERAELRFEHDFFAALCRFVEIFARIADVRQELVAVFFEIFHHRFHRDGFGAVNALDRQIFPFHDVFQTLF